MASFVIFNAAPLATLDEKAWAGVGNARAGIIYYKKGPPPRMIQPDIPLWSESE